jgi:hypothetical protein
MTSKGYSTETKEHGAETLVQQVMEEVSDMPSALIFLTSDYMSLALML